jgi:hypothetical protein
MPIFRKMKIGADGSLLTDKDEHIHSDYKQWLLESRLNKIERAEVFIEGKLVERLK